MALRNVTAFSRFCILYWQEGRGDMSIAFSQAASPAHLICSLGIKLDKDNKILFLAKATIIVT